MSSWVTVRLDTRPPSLTLDGSQDAGNPTLLTLDLTSDADVAEMKVWGAIDDTDPLNAFYGDNEGGADWIPFDADAQVRVHPAGGNIFVRVRDDVWNESVAEMLAVTTGTVPPPTPVPAPPVPFGEPVERRRRVEHKTVTSRSRLRMRSSYHVEGRTRRHVDRSRLVVSTSSRVLARSQHSSSLLVRSSARGATLRVARSVLRGAQHATVHRRAEGPDTEAALIELDIL